MICCQITPAERLGRVVGIPAEVVGLRKSRTGACSAHVLHVLRCCNQHLHGREIASKRQFTFTGLLRSIHLLLREAGLPALGVFRQVRTGRRVFHEARSVMPHRPALPPITYSFYLRSDLHDISEDGISDSGEDKAPVARAGRGSHLRL